MEKELPWHRLSYHGTDMRVRFKIEALNKFAHLISFNLEKKTEFFPPQTCVIFYILKSNPSSKSSEKQKNHDNQNISVFHTAFAIYFVICTFFPSATSFPFY